MFYDTFITLCNNKGMTPYKFSQDTGIGQSTISMWKKKGAFPTADKLPKIADYFGVSTDYLLGRVENGDEYILEAKDYPDVMQPLIKGNLSKMVLAITPTIGHQTTVNIKEILDQELKDTLVSYDEVNPNPVTDLLALLPDDLRNHPISLYDVLDYIGKDEEIMRKLKENGYDDLGALTIPDKKEKASTYFYSERLKHLRKSRGLSKQDVADLLQIDNAAYEQYEKGEAHLPNETLVRAANCFDISTDYLLGRNDDPTPPFRAPETFYTIPMGLPPQKEKAPDTEGLASDPLIAFYGDIKEHLSQDDLDDIQTIMKAKAERNKGKKQDELGRKGL